MKIYKNILIAFLIKIHVIGRCSAHENYDSFKHKDEIKTRKFYEVNTVPDKTDYCYIEILNPSLNGYTPLIYTECAAIFHLNLIGTYSICVETECCSDILSFQHINEGKADYPKFTQSNIKDDKGEPTTKDEENYEIHSSNDDIGNDEGEPTAKDEEYYEIYSSNDDLENDEIEYENLEDKKELSRSSFIDEVVKSIFSIFESNNSDYDDYLDDTFYDIDDNNDSADDEERTTSTMNDDMVVEESKDKVDKTDFTERATKSQNPEAAISEEEEYIPYLASENYEDETVDNTVHTLPDMEHDHRESNLSSSEKIAEDEIENGEINNNIENNVGENEILENEVDDQIEEIIAEDDEI